MQGVGMVVRMCADGVFVCVQGVLRNGVLFWSRRNPRHSEDKDVTASVHTSHSGSFSFKYEG